MNKNTLENGPIRSHFLDMAPPNFPPTEADVRERYGFSGPIRRLHLNECPYPPAPGVVAAIANAAVTMNRYPDPRCRTLRAALARRTKLDVDHIVVGNGSAQLIHLLALATLDEDSEAVMPAPSYPGYIAACHIIGAKAIRVPLRDDGANDVAGLVEAITERTRILFCTPVNNPTGGMLGGDDFDHLIGHIPDRVLLVMDDAYHEFAIQAGGLDVLPSIKKRTGPWAVLRTFSKAYGLAGVRIGYGLFGSTDIAETIYKARSKFEINAIALAAATAALEDNEYRDRILDECANQRQRLADGCTDLGLRPMPSVANYITVRLPANGQDTAKILAQRGIIVSPLAAPGYDDCIRITIGLSEDIDAVLAELTNLFGSGVKTSNSQEI